MTQPGTTAVRLLLLTASLCAYWHVWLDIGTIGIRDQESSHVLLVPLVSLFLVWTRVREQRGSTGRKEAEPNFRDHALALGLILSSAVMHEVGLKYGILAAWHASAVLCFYGALTATFGVRQLRKHLPAVVLLLGVIPVPGLLRQQLALHLQLYSATVTDFVMTACGVGIERSGVILSSNGVNIEIAEACNGMRMLLAILLVIYAVCFAFPLSTRKRAALLLLSPFIACFLNTARLITTIALYSFVSEQTGSTFHDVSGWLIPLGFLLTVVLIVCPNSQEAAAPKTHSHRTVRLSGRWLTVEFAVLTVLVICNSQLLPRREQIAAHQSAVSTAISETPYAIGDWVARDDEFRREEVELLKPVQALRRTYRNLKTGQEITVSVIACGQTRDLIGHEPGICFVGQGWKKSRQLNAEWQTDRGQVNGRYYRFRVHRGGVSATNTVTSVLVVPGGESTGDTRDVAEAASDFRKNPFGALAIQMQSTSSFDDTVWQSVSSQFLKMLQPAMLSYHSCLQEGEAE